MAIVFERIKAGEVLWDVHREKMGNTRMSRTGSWPVRVISIDHAKGEAMCSWNHNPAEHWSASRLRKLRRSPAKGSRA